MKWENGTHCVGDGKRGSVVGKGGGCWLEAHVVGKGKRRETMS